MVFSRPYLNTLLFFLLPLYELLKWYMDVMAKEKMSKSICPTNQV